MSKHKYWITRKDRAVITALPCNVCGQEPGDPDNGIEVDHIKPRSKGGIDHISNYAPLCARCNNKKSGDDPSEPIAYFNSLVLTQTDVRRIMQAGGGR